VAAALTLGALHASSCRLLLTSHVRGTGFLVGSREDDRLPLGQAMPRRLQIQIGRQPHRASGPSEACLAEPTTQVAQLVGVDNGVKRLDPTLVHGQDDHAD
jgi:hypothetical protein